jgi:hypothetical protein
MHGMLCLNAGDSIAEASSVDCSSCVIKEFEVALAVVLPSKQPSVGSTRASNFKFIASLASVCWPLTYYHQLALEEGTEQVINLIECALNLTQRPILIRIVSNDCHYG